VYGKVKTTYINLYIDTTLFYIDNAVLLVWSKHMMLNVMSLMSCPKQTTTRSYNYSKTARDLGLNQQTICGHVLTSKFGHIT
jgi:hypothetical protein